MTLFFNDRESGPDHSYEDELWKVGAQRAVMVPDDTALRDAVVDEAHRCGHLGMDATLSRLKHHYFWKHGGLSMRQHVAGMAKHNLQALDQFHRCKNTDRIAK